MPEGLLLVVDDEPGILRLCQRLLEREGFDVLTTAHPEQALAMLERQRVDLLLVDIRMPELDGFQLMSLARQKLQDLTVVMMTGYGTLETAVEALHQGVDGLILKPFSGDSLIQGVLSALQETQRKRDISRLNTLRTLFDFTEELFTETDLSKLRDLIVNAMCTHLDGATALLYRKLPADETVKLVEQRGEISASALTQLEAELIEPAESRSTLLCVSRNVVDRKGYPYLQPLLAELQLESLLCMSILREDQRGQQTENIFLAARSDGQAAFTPADQEMFAILAEQASVALENADLYAELRNTITQLEKSQQALLLAEKMAAAGRLTASIAHEINNPLQSVQNCLYLTGREDIGWRERRKYLDLARGELDRLMITVQRMLDLYRPGVRDRKFERIDALVEHVLLLVGQQLEKNGVIVRSRLSAGSSEVMIVAPQIQQVLINLIVNAMEAMPGGGTIYIETALKYGKVEILIADDGPGIPRNVRAHLFEPFTSTKENGTGLGLVLSYGIISAHGGSLELVTGPGKGACFQILLPLGVNS